MTKKEMFTVLLEVAKENGRADLVEGINHELELLQKKSNYRSNTLSKKQVENNEFKTQILDTLANSSQPMTIKSLMEFYPNFSNQKISRLLTDLINDNKVKREIIKKVRYYSIA